MKRDLEEAHNRFQTAADPEIVTQWVSWPEYETFTKYLIAVAKLFANAAMDQKMRDEHSSYWSLRQALRDTPLHPYEYIDVFSFVVGTSLLAGEIGSAVEKLRESAKVLCEVENPMRHELYRVLAGETTRKIHGVKTVKLLVPLKLSSAVNAVIAKTAIPDKIIQAMGPSEAKRSDLADVMILFGAPENHANYFKHGAEKSREVAWMFNAPSARKIVVLQLADCPAFDSSKYEIWPGSNQFDAKAFGNRPPVFIEGFQQTIQVREVVTVPSSPGDPVVDATLVHLFDGRYIYYSDTFPPYPICVRSDEFGVEIDDDVRVSELRPGDVLLIRTGSASRSFLRTRAISWLMERNTEREVQRIVEVADTYKKSLKATFGQSEFIARLVRDGMEEHYIRNQIARAFVESTIATQRSENFIKIANAMGFEYGQNEWEAIVRIQTAHRQAGHAAVQELRENVLADESWQEVVSEPGIATLNAGSAGEIVLVPVVQKPDQKVHVAVNSIGHLHTNLRLFNE